MTTHNGTHGYSAFDGKLIFHMTGQYSLEREVLISTITRQYPQYPDLEDTQLLNAINTFLGCVGTTRDIEFKLDEDDHPALHNLREFWRIWQTSSDDYVSLFRTFMRLVDVDVSDVWWDAYQAHKPTRLLAQPELQVSEEELDTDQKKSDKKSSKRTSKA